MNTQQLLLPSNIEEHYKQAVESTFSSPLLHLYFIITQYMYNYTMHVMCNGYFSGDFCIHMLLHRHMHVHAFTPTERAGESSTPLWLLKASMPGIPPRFFLVTDPTHTHVLFKFKEQDIRGRHERQWWTSTLWRHALFTAPCITHIPTIHPN